MIEWSMTKRERPSETEPAVSPLSFRINVGVGSVLVFAAKTDEWMRMTPDFIGRAMERVGLNRIAADFPLINNYGADLGWPLILYPGLRAYRGLSSSRAALTAFTLLTGFEFLQLPTRRLPSDVYGPRFDPLDIAAYGAGSILAYSIDRFFSRRQTQGEAQIILENSSRLQTNVNLKRRKRKRKN